LIDLHSHILPGIDDGAKTLEDSIELAKHSVANGVTHMMCTPHIHQGIFDNNVETIELSFTQLIAAVRQNNIALKLAYSCEIRITPDILTWVAHKSLPFIGEWKGKQALLLELPHSHIPPGVENLVRWLLKNNIQPIIPHPERNRDIIADYNRINMLKRIGCIFQVTAGAFIGRFNEQVQTIAERLLSENLIAYVASDMHNLHRRPNDMLACKQALTQIAGSAKAQALVYDIPFEISQNMNWQ
jgi:protein-tyrosine phosphatase